MSDSKKTAVVACKVTPETHERLRELAYDRRTDVSKLLRGKIDELLAEADSEKSTSDAGAPADD
jgi:hypothetical protein